VPSSPRRSSRSHFLLAPMISGRTAWWCRNGSKHPAAGRTTCTTSRPGRFMRWPTAGTSKDTARCSPTDASCPRRTATIGFSTRATPTARRRRSTASSHPIDRSVPARVRPGHSAAASAALRVSKARKAAGFSGLCKRSTSTAAALCFRPRSRSAVIRIAGID
jgi:hypothetical protein